MSPTVLLDVSTNVFIGHVLALSAYRQIRRAPAEALSAFFWRAMGYSLFVFVPVAGYFYYAYPDWSWVYFVDSGRLPPWLGPLVLASYAAGMFYGFLTAESLIRLGRIDACLWSMVASLVLTVGLFAFTWQPYMLLGSYQQYHSGQATSIFADARFMFAINGGGALMTLGAVGVAAFNWIEGRRLSD